jgi:hypothetical protein
MSKSQRIRLLLLLLLVTQVWAAELVNFSVTSIPTGATITIGGIPTGYTPTSTKLQPGDYTLTLTLAGFESWEQKVSVQPGQASTIAAKLRPKQKSAPRGDAAPQREKSPLIVSSGGESSPAAASSQAAANTPHQTTDSQNDGSGSEQPRASETTPKSENSSSSSAPKTVHVREYTRKDGTVVRAHDRSTPGTKSTSPQSSGRRR